MRRWIVVTPQRRWVAIWRMLYSCSRWACAIDAASVESVRSSSSGGLGNLTYARGCSGLEGLHEQVVVVRHQAIGENPPLVARSATDYKISRKRARSAMSR